jgi:zinc D-Ala-D-Ala carboxypeptidase
MQDTPARPYVAAFLLIAGSLITLSAQTLQNSDKTLSDPKVKRTALVRDMRGPAENSAIVVTAALRNTELSNDLKWTFGGKEQHGWYLYASLIRRLIGTDQQPSSGGFASALWLWQVQAGLNPSGVLDDESLYAMVAEWQARRIQDRTSAQPDQLITAPIADFFDPTREEELRQVERGTYAAYKRMVAAAIADKSLGLAVGENGELAAEEKFLKIMSSFRTREYQDFLRRQSPSAGRAGLAINSPHFTGRALDLYVGGDPVDTTDSNRAIQINSRVYQWLIRNAENFGFRPYFYEPWHWEHVEQK